MIQSLYEPFKHWAATGSVWLISDPHFDDPDCFLMDPNWIDPNDYINYINTIVHKTDTLVCLGDCGNLYRFKDIKCPNRILIRGNHDDGGNGIYKSFFTEIYKGALFIAPQILLSHEPINGLKFCLNIHGHDHSMLPAKPYYEDDLGGRHLNIAANIARYKARNLSEIIKQGAISDLPTIHRITIDQAIKKKKEKYD